MHAQIQKDGPGKCPICGMALVKKTIKSQPPKKTPSQHQPDKPKVNKPKPVDHEHMHDHQKDMDTAMKADTSAKMEMPGHDQEMAMDTTSSDPAG